MTGDGVNDAPSIKRPTSASAWASPAPMSPRTSPTWVLADDNFATIIGACEEGRRIYDNIRKVIQFLLSANLAEVFSVFIATLIGFTIFQPVQLLWVNLVTDCFPARSRWHGGRRGRHHEAQAAQRQGRCLCRQYGRGLRGPGLIITALVLASFFVGVYFDMGYIHIADTMRRQCRRGKA